MNCDDRSALSHVFNKMILVFAPYLREDGSSNAHLGMNVPIAGTKSMAKQHRINANSDHTTHHISDPKRMTREHVNIPQLIREDKLFATQFYSAHCEGLRLTSILPREPSWPEIESHNVFHPSVDKKLCPMCNLLTCAKESSGFCALCNLWVHCDGDSQCMKYWKDIDMDMIEDNENINYYCPTCIDTLTSYQKSTKEECNVDNLLTCLRSFNLEGVEIKDAEEIEILNVVLSEALGN